MDWESKYGVCGHRLVSLVLAIFLGTVCDGSERTNTSDQSAVKSPASRERQGVPARFVQRRARSPEWRQLKEMEDYYDDLEDFYNDRDPQLAEYYESLENYYEDVRKGRRPFLPAEALAVPPSELPYDVPALPRYIMRQASPQANLERSYRELRAQLARFDTGETWLRYLALPIADEGNTPLEALQTPEAKQQLSEGLERFDRVATNPEFQVIARLSSFGRTRYSLRSFTRWLDQQSVTAEPTVPLGGEEIPTPAPIGDDAPADGPLLPPQSQ